MTPVNQQVKIGIKGMDCADCASHVRSTITGFNGVRSVDVLLSAEKAVIDLDRTLVDLREIQEAVEALGYSVLLDAQPDTPEAISADAASADFSRAALRLFAIVFSVILVIVVAGEGLGLFDAVTDQIPPLIGYALVLIAALPTLRHVIQATLQRRIIAHTLMTVGMIAALVVGEWLTAAIVLLFIRIGDYAERFTAERSRSALRNLAALAPRTARVERQDLEIELPISEVRAGDVVVVRPGEKIPVDGEVISGQATINQATITGESMPVEATVGARVFAASIAQLGSLRICTTRIGPDTTFGRIIRLVEEAELHRGHVQRLADRFSGYFLPFVTAIAALTYFFSRDPLATAAVLVVACSCSFALATPIAMLASIGAAARHGLLIKGGRYIEALASADVMLLDKTGTLTQGLPQITDVVPLNGVSSTELLTLAASVERDSEHPLAEAVRLAAQTQGLALRSVENFAAIPGMGVRAAIGAHTITVGSPRLLNGNIPDAAVQMEAQGRTVLCVSRDDEIIGLLGAADTLRAEVPGAIQALREGGMRHIVMLTGDNERVAQAIASELGIDYQANLLPEDKIAVVRQYQAQGHTVIMVGDGVNDAPALAQADAGIAMGAAGTDIALEAAHVALMRDDWSLVPEVLAIARRTMRVVRLNIAFTAIYNFFGLSLAALGILPPVLAAAAQSLPDIGILANSSRLLRYRRASDAASQSTD